MDNPDRLFTYVGIIDNGKIAFVTDEDGATEPGRRARACTKQEAKDIVYDLNNKGINGAVIIMMVKKHARLKLFNPVANTALAEDAIIALESKGFKRWIRGNKYRLYINCHNLKCDGGSVGYKCARPTYIDVVDGEVYSDCGYARSAARKILDSVLMDTARPILTPPTAPFGNPG